MTPSDTWFGEGITPISRLGQSVGTEANPRFGRHDVVDHRLVLPGIEVIDQLRSFVSEIPSVFELHRAFHTRSRYYGQVC